MSFRGRLNLFFLLLVVVPLIAVGFVLLRTLDSASRSRVESRLSAQATTAQAVASEVRSDADDTAQAIARDRELAAGLRARDPVRVRRRAQRLLAPGTPARRIRLTLAGGRVVDVGGRTAILPSTRRLVAPGGGQLAVLETSVTGPRSFAARLGRVTGLRAEIREAGSGRVLAGGHEVPRRIPAPGTVAKVPDSDLVGVTVRQRGFDGTSDDIVLLARNTGRRAPVGDRLTLIGILVLFLVIAAAGALAVSRSLQRQVGVLLAGAKRLGRGEFDQEIPTTGDDELAQLADAFNHMSRQLHRRLDELEDERGRLRQAIRRIGESFASNLDREGLLETVARAAADGVRAEAGRARTTVGAGEEVAIAGALEGLEGVLDAAEARVAEGGEGLVSDGEAHALAVLMAATGPGGVVSVARRDAPFTAADAEIVAYLSGQAAVSLENVGRHEAVAREAETDPLTGLANRRRFDGLLAAAIDRARRDGRPVSLLLLDLDRFKAINDRHGHPVGDAVLREVAWTLRDGVRGIDDAARLGGEEFAVILPGTDTAGATVLAERLRVAIDEVRLPTDEGRDVTLTGSIGIGTQQGPGVGAGELMGLADGALYRAKREGRNRTVTADASGEHG